MESPARWRTPWGTVEAASNGQALTRLVFTDEPPNQVALDDVLRRVQAQLDGYANGTLRAFDVPLAPQGTDFQQRVWQAVSSIPFGQTQTYAQVAASLGDPNASRAVGLANGKNPILLVVPCHRVVGADGSLTGYAGGLERKRNLLIHEQKLAGHVLF